MWVCVGAWACECRFLKKPGEGIGSPGDGINDLSDLPRFEQIWAPTAMMEPVGVLVVAVPSSPLWTAPSETVILNKSFLLHVASVRYLATMSRKVNNADPGTATASSDGSKAAWFKGLYAAPFPVLLSPVHCDMNRVYRTSLLPSVKPPTGSSLPGWTEPLQNHTQIKSIFPLWFLSGIEMAVPYVLSFCHLTGTMGQDLWLWIS